MNQKAIDDIMLVGKYMEVPNLFVLHFKKDKEPLGVYIAEDESGWIDYTDVGINFYSPDSDWNTLMPICKKIIDSYFADREDIFEGLHLQDIKKTFEGVVRFIEFWYDDTKPKTVWTDSPESSVQWERERSIRMSK